RSLSKGRSFNWKGEFKLISIACRPAHHLIFHKFFRRLLFTKSLTSISQLL
ncbi:unnamed protein product, partial [Allacma fusca]